MSPRENTEAEKDTGRKTSLLFGLFQKVSGGRNAQKKAQISEKEENPVIPEGSAPEEAPPPAPTFDALGAPEEITEYFHQFCLAYGRSDQRFSVGDFCAGPLPEEGFLKQIFSQLGSKAAAALKEFDRQTRVAALQAERLARSRDSEDPAKAKEETEAVVPSADGQVMIFSAPDWTAAWGFVLPALGNGEKPTQHSVLSALGEQKICYGVDNGAVDRMVSPEGALTLIKLAACDPPVPGEDGRTVEHFSRTVGSPQIQENDRGVVNFDDLNWLTHIDEGTVICDIIEPTQGKPGTDIQGKTIRPYNGKKAVLPRGDGVVLNPEGNALIAKVTGQISFKDGRFHVYDVITVQGNVDNSTGSLDVQGDLVIHGNVQAGFTIRATGNITIGGQVEGSQVTAGGSIVVSRGMNGNVTGRLTAGHDVVCKYIENAKVRAEGDVYMDSIVNCDISAKGKVVVKTGRGVIIGGTIRSMGGIEAKTIGNLAGRTTTLIIGPTKKFLEEMARVEGELAALDQQGTKLGPAVRKMKEKPLKAALEQMEQLKEAMLRKQIVAGNLMPMAQVSIGGLQKNIGSSHSPCRIFLDPKEGDIKVINV